MCPDLFPILDENVLLNFHRLQNLEWAKITKNLNKICKQGKYYNPKSLNFEI